MGLYIWDTVRAHRREREKERKKERERERERERGREKDIKSRFLYSMKVSV